MRGGLAENGNTPIQRGMFVYSARGELLQENSEKNGDFSPCFYAGSYVRAGAYVQAHKRRRERVRREPEGLLDPPPTLKSFACIARIPRAPSCVKKFSPIRFCGALCWAV